MCLRPGKRRGIVYKKVVFLVPIQSQFLKATNLNKKEKWERSSDGFFFFNIILEAQVK